MDDWLTYTSLHASAFDSLLYTIEAENAGLEHDGSNSSFGQNSFKLRRLFCMILSFFQPCYNGLSFSVLHSPPPVSLFIKYPVYALDNGQRSVSRPVIVVCVDGDGRGLGGEANVCHWSHGSEQNRYIDDRRCQPLARWYCRILFACLCERKLNSWTRLVRKMEILHTIAYVPR